MDKQTVKELIIIVLLGAASVPLLLTIVQALLVHAR
jgi:hypothetical protein